MIACPKCGGLAVFNIYFGAYRCCHCDWKDDTFNRDRANGVLKPRMLATEKLCQGEVCQPQNCK